MTSLKDHDSDLDNHVIYKKHRQQQCAQTCYLPTHDGNVSHIHSGDHQVTLTADNRNSEPTYMSELAGIHKPHLKTSSQLYGPPGLYKDTSKCAVSDCNRPPMENVPLVECAVPSSTQLRTNSGKVKRPISCETPGYFVLEHQS